MRADNKQPGSKGPMSKEKESTCSKALASDEDLPGIFGRIPEDADASISSR